VELCQREGRARQRDSAFVILEQRNDRPVADLRRVQQRQEQLIESFDPNSVQPNTQADHQAQKSRERNAASLLSRSDNPVSVLKQYRQKTKARLDEESVIENGNHVFVLKYESALRSFTATGRGTTKKAAKQQAASSMLGMLRGMD